MRIIAINMLVMGTLVAGAQTSLHYDFNDFKDGPIDGQKNWDVYDKVVDSSELSIVDELGTTEEKGNKALIIRASQKEIRCVTEEPARWLPGMTLTVEFNFKIAVEPGKLSSDKPALRLLVGDSLLRPQSRFEIGIDALSNGDWILTGAMPDPGSKKLYSEVFLFRSEDEVAISEWHKFKLVAKKLNESDTFAASATIVNSLSGEVVSEVQFSSKQKDKIARAIWGAPNAHVGFHASKDLLGLVCVDDLKISSSE